MAAASGRTPPGQLSDSSRVSQDSPTPPQQRASVDSGDLRKAAQAALERAEAAGVSKERLRVAKSAQAFQQGIETRVRDALAAEVRGLVQAALDEAATELRAAIAEIRSLWASTPVDATGSVDHHPCGGCGIGSELVAELRSIMGEVREALLYPMPEGSPVRHGFTPQSSPAPQIPRTPEPWLFPPQSQSARLPGGKDCLDLLSTPCSQPASELQSADIVGSAESVRDLRPAAEKPMDRPEQVVRRSFSEAAASQGSMREVQHLYHTLGIGSATSANSDAAPNAPKKSSTRGLQGSSSTGKVERGARHVANVVTSMPVASSGSRSVSDLRRCMDVRRGRVA